MKKGLIFGALAAVAGAAYLVKRYRNAKMSNDHTNSPHPSSRHSTDVFARAKDGNHQARVTG